jgi:5-deoxy-D-glucuronate isomerase
MRFEHRAECCLFVEETMLLSAKARCEAMQGLCAAPQQKQQQLKELACDRKERVKRLDQIATEAATAPTVVCWVWAGSQGVR